MFGGEQVAAYVPLAALRSTLPKESERELALAEEQQQLEAEEAREPKKHAWPNPNQHVFDNHGLSDSTIFASVKANAFFAILGCIVLGALLEPRASEGARDSPHNTRMTPTVPHTQEP